MRAWLARHCFYPLQEALNGRDSMRYWRQLEQSQWWTPAQLRDLQYHKLAAMIRHAIQHTGFYRRRFGDAGVSGETLSNLDDLPAVPLLTRDDIRANREDMVAEPWRRQVRSSCTSGSTGSPLIFWVGRRRCRSDVAARLRAHRWFNIAPGDPAVYLWGSCIEFTHHDRLKAIRDWLINERLLSAFELSNQRLHHYAAVLHRTRPHYMYSYASTLWRFAQFVSEHRPDLRGVIRKVAFATGEQMLPHWREYILQNLDCPVAEEYGCREGGLIAHECPAGAYHISAENLIVEILDAAGQPAPEGEEGEIVLTNLEAYAMPFIRYRTGDRGAFRRGPCPCGRELPMMWRQTGRSFEFLVTNDGTRITGVSLSRDFKEIDGIAHYRVIQQSRGEVRVIVVRGPRFCHEHAENRIRKFVCARLGDATRVVVEYTDELPPHPSGKYRYVINAMN